MIPGLKNFEYEKTILIGTRWPVERRLKSFQNMVTFANRHINQDQTENLTETLQQAAKEAIGNEFNNGGKGAAEEFSKSLWYVVSQEFPNFNSDHINPESRLKLHRNLHFFQ